MLSKPQIPQPTFRPPMLFTVSGLIILIWGLSVGRPFLLPTIIAGFLAFLMSPLHRFLTKRLRFPDSLAVVVSAVVFLSPLVLLVYLLLQQGKSLAQDIPQLFAAGQVKLQTFTTHSELAGKLGLDFASLLEKISDSLGQGVGMLLGGLATVADLGSQMVLIFVFSILFLASRVQLRQSAEHILARHKDLDVKQLLDQVTDLIQRFLVARMVIVVIIGSLAALALHLLGVKYSAFLGTFFGILTLVPAVGSIIAVLTASLTALATGHTFGEVAIIAAVLFGISSIENYYLTPKMVGGRLNLNALTCFLGLFAGGLLWGIWGMFLSVPLLGVLRIVFSATPALSPWAELLADKPVIKNPTI